jgi:hypothetical protein
MHGLTRLCGTPRTSRRGRRPTSVIRDAHSQVLQAWHNRQCFKPHPAHQFEDGDYYEDDAHVMGVHHRVSEEIDHVGGGNTSTRTTSMRYTCRKMARNVCGHGDAANGGHSCSVVLGVE